jgi:hypothetical protein
MRRTILILALILSAGALWRMTVAQSERNTQYQRDRNGSDRRDRDRRDRDRSRDSGTNRERTMESATNRVEGNIEREIIPSEGVATNSAPVDPMSYEAFRIIAQRNIFDPTRRAVSNRTTTESPPERPKRMEAFTLLGSINYEKGDFAFFDGTRSEFRKSVKAGDSIAGYKVAEIAPKHVTLEADGKKVEMPVGSQMKRREGEGEWQVNSQVENFESASTNTSSSSESGSSGGESKPSSGNGEVNEVLKRLLEKAKRGE